MKVLILHDQIAESARADEADAMVQVQIVREALESLGHVVTTLGLTLDLDAGRAALFERAPDMVFNLCESLGGLARLIHVPCDLLDALGVQYTGARAAAMMSTSNKIAAKQMLRLAGLPTAPWCTADDLIGSQSSLPSHQCIIKSVWEHASIGIDETSIVDVETAAHLREEITARLDILGGDAFAEAFIEGREFNLALLAGDDPLHPLVLPPAEIVFENFAKDRPKIVGYQAKWQEDSFEYGNTLRRYDFPAADEYLIEQLMALAIECWRLFEVRGYARVDFRVDAEGQPWILEVNVNPCLSPDAGFAAALERAKVPFAQAIGRIVEDVPDAARVAKLI